MSKASSSNYIAVIPARGGSKRIPGKNIKFFAGKPMIAWPIEAALRSGCFSRIIVSTDDNEIAAVAREWGAEVPFIRPARLSDDHTPTTPVIGHAISQLYEPSQLPDAVCCIYATAPFLNAEDLRSGLDMLTRNDADYAVSVTSYAFPIQRALRITEDQHLSMFQSEHFSTRSQDLEQAWHDAGQFYWGRSQAWLSGLPVFSGNSLPIKLPRHRVQDIDDQEDWRRAEILFRINRETDIS